MDRFHLNDNVVELNAPIRHKRKKDTRDIIGRFKKGQSGNPKGRPLGARDKATQLAEALLAGQAEALIQKAVQMALAGDTLMMKLCVDRLVPPMQRIEHGSDANNPVAPPVLVINPVKAPVAS